MKISFDYYTKNIDALVEAYKLAVSACDDTTDTDVSIRYDAEDKIHNLMGTMDHTRITELFAYFEENGFTEDRYSL